MITGSNRHRSLRSSSLLFLMAIGCGSSDDDRTVRIFKGAAIKDAVVTGFVLDDEKETPVPAEVRVAGTAVRAQADGSFQAPAMAGRVRVEVRADGYLKTFRDVVAGDRSVPMPFKVAQRAPKEAVGPMGGMIAHRGATLVVAPNTFTAQTMIAMTYLTRIRVAAVTATPQFIDSTGVPRRAVALVDVDADAQAMVGMRARVPVPPDATMDSVSGFTIDDTGNWATAVAPISVSGGFAEFVFNGNGQLGVAIDARRADNRKLGYVVTERGGSGREQGEVLEGGMEINVGSRAVAIVDQHGSRIELPPGTRARVQVPAGEMPPAASRVAPYAGEVTVTAGRARVVVPPPAPNAPKTIKLALKGTAGKYNVTGTGLTLAACLNGTDFLDFLEVVEGTVEVEAEKGTEKKTETVGAGESALVCANCKAAPVPMCTDATGDAGAGTQGGLPTTPLDGSVGMSTLEGGVPIDGPAGTTADATAPGDATAATDGSTVGAEGGAPPPPPPPPPPPADAGAPADAAPDAAVMPDAAPEPDTALPAPDVAPPPPDAAPTAEPDAAPPPPPPPPPSMLTISPTAEDFGVAPIYTGGQLRTFTVSNTGGMDSGPPLVMSAGEFAVQTNGCTSPLAAGGSCRVIMQFLPQNVGPRTGTVTVQALPGGTATANLSGIGASQNPGDPPPPPPPQDGGGHTPPDAEPEGPLVITPAAHDFGPVDLEDYRTQEFTVLNTSSTITLTHLQIFIVQGSERNDYRWTTNCPTALSPQGQCSVTVEYDPAWPGPFPATLHGVSRTDQQELIGEDTSQLSGVGVGPDGGSRGGTGGLGGF